MSGWAMWNTASPETTNRTCVISFCRCFFVSLLSVSIHFNKNRRPERRITHPTYYQPKQCTIRNASTFIPPKNAYSNFSLPPEITGWPFHLLPRKRANKKTFAEVAATKKNTSPKTGASNHLKRGPKPFVFPSFVSQIFWPLLSREISGRKSSPNKSMYSFHSLILHKKGHTQFLDFKPGSPKTFPGRILPWTVALPKSDFSLTGPKLCTTSAGCEAIRSGWVLVGGVVMGFDICFHLYAYWMGWLAHCQKLLKSQILCLIKIVGHFHPEFL